MGSRVIFTSVIVVVAFVSLFVLVSFYFDFREERFKSLERETVSKIQILQQAVHKLHRNVFCPFLLDSPIILVTSTSPSIINSGNGKLFKSSTDIPLWIFHDSSQEKNEVTIDISQISARNVCLTDIFEVQPLLIELIRVNGTLDKFYDYAGDMEPCDQPLRVKSGKLLVRKIAAIEYALSQLRKNQIIVWSDTDVLIQNDFDDTFFRYVSAFDISLIPFTVNPRWGVKPMKDFEKLEDPYWRIESGLVALKVGYYSKEIMSKVIKMYDGGLLRKVKECFKKNKNKRPDICEEIWFQRNVYLDDIFVFSMVLHEYKTEAKIGWFHHCQPLIETHTLCAHSCRYPFPHVAPNQTQYTSPFPIDYYACHKIGSGAYSSKFRESKTTAVVPELAFSRHQRFNDTLEFRFKGASAARLHDYYWTVEDLERRQRAGLWPNNWPIQHLPRFEMDLI